MIGVCRLSDLVTYKHLRWYRAELAVYPYIVDARQMHRQGLSFVDRPTSMDDGTRARLILGRWHGDMV